MKTSPETVEQYLRRSAALLTESETPHLDARLILRHVLGLDDAGLILEGARVLTASEEGELDRLVARRATGEPVAYITGEKEFFGLTFKTAPGVLTPRPDTETLIEAALESRDCDESLRILDLGVGTGCLLLTLLVKFRKASGLGVDINITALETARANCASLGLADRASFAASDWGESIRGPFDLVVSNPPYIRLQDKERLPPDVRAFEDPRALCGGEDGLDAYRRIFVEAPRFLAEAGLMIVEIGTDQNETVSDLARNAFPGAVVKTRGDLAGRPRAIVIDGRRK